jgi:hypothetical protein
MLKRVWDKQKTTFPAAKSEEEERRFHVATANPGKGGKAGSLWFLLQQ